jgi:hypothetical protein
VSSVVPVRQTGPLGFGNGPVAAPGDVEVVARRTRPTVSMRASR